MVCIDLTGGHRTVILAANEPGVGGLSNVGGDGHGSHVPCHCGQADACGTVVWL